MPVGINERLTKLRILLSKSRHLSVISVYAPTLNSPDVIKEQFYEQLDQVIRSTPQNDKLVILVDFNSRVGRDYNNCEGIPGRHGVGKTRAGHLQRMESLPRSTKLQAQISRRLFMMSCRVSGRRGRCQMTSVMP